MALGAMGHIGLGTAGGRVGPSDLVPLVPRTIPGVWGALGAGVLEHPGGLRLTLSAGFVFFFCLCPQQRLPARSLI